MANKITVEKVSRTLDEMLDGTFIGMHLGLDRFGPHDIESDVFLMEPENYNPKLKQKVDEIYGLKHKGRPLYEVCKKAASITAYIPGVLFYPFEKMIHAYSLAYNYAAAKLTEKYPVLKRLSAASAGLYLVDATQPEDLQKNNEVQEPAQPGMKDIGHAVNQ